jgi:ABC-type lipoprotein export system ATPase subunit
MGLLLQLNADGATIILITHDGSLADQLPRRIEMLDGRVVSDGGSDPGTGRDRQVAVHVRGTPVDGGQPKRAGR